MLNANELARYDRQMMIHGFGTEGQEKLKQARVFIAGAGGLGCPISIYLVAAGVGTIRIADHDKVDLSNLNRQILHWEENVGMSKITSAADKLKRLNSNVTVETVGETITDTNIGKLTAGFNVIVDAMDNLPTRYILNKAALEAGIAFVHGAVYGFEGRAMTVIPGQTACLRCVYRGATTPREKFPVIGVTPAVIACIQATEVIKYIVGLGKLLTNRLLVYDGLELRFTEFKVKKDPNCEHCRHFGSKE